MASVVPSPNAELGGLCETPLPQAADLRRRLRKTGFCISLWASAHLLTVTGPSWPPAPKANQRHVLLALGEVLAYFIRALCQDLDLHDVLAV